MRQLLMVEGILLYCSLFRNIASNHGGRTMRAPAPCVLLAVALLFCAIPVYAFDAPHLWSQRHGGPGTDVAWAVAVDATGNVYITGSCWDGANFGGIDVSNPGGSFDMFVAKYNAAGVHQWSRPYLSTSQSAGNAIKVDGAGNVIVTGHFTGTIDFGGGPLVSAGNDDIFLVKLNTDGVHQWSQRFGAAGDDFGLALAVDGSNNIYLSGYFNNIVNFGGVNYGSAGLNDVFLAKYNSGGAHQWSRRFGGVGNDAGRGLAADASGNVFMTGSFVGNVDFGGGALVPPGGVEIVLAKYSGVAGAHLWSKRFGNTGDDYGTAVAVNAAGHVFVTGWFNGTINMGGANLVNLGLTDVFLARFDGVGTHVWSQRFGGFEDDGGTSIAVEPVSSTVSMIGYFGGSTNFGGAAVSSLGTSDIYIASYDGNGLHRWSRRAGNYYNDVGEGIAAAATGDVVATGYFNYQSNFGGNNLTGEGTEDVFLAKYGGTSTEPVISSITDIGNDQGRKVKIVFSRSGQDDAAAELPVKSYEAYREIAAAPMPAPGSRGQLLDAGWTHVGTVAAHAKGEYSIDAPTIGDSTIVLGQYLSTFFIRAATDEPEVYFDSTPEDGYSVDNLAPGIPNSLIYNDGELSWDESADEDFDYFTVYGSSTDSFGDAVIIDYTISTGMDVSSSPYLCYFVTATDFSGNEGKPAKLNTLSDTGGVPRSYVLSVSNYPNPFNPRTTVKYTVPSRGHVSVRVFDARGVLVATLFDGERSAGAYSVSWAGQTKDAAVAASGVYFARIEHNGATRVKKIVLLK